MTTEEYEKARLAHAKVWDFIAANPQHPAVVAVEAAQVAFDAAWDAFIAEVTPLLEGGCKRAETDAVYDKNHKATIDPLQAALNAAFWTVAAAADKAAEEHK